MILTILIAFISLIGLIILHEFGHFVLAKKFGVKVEEFGIGYPPKIFGKKIGQTIYSLNLLPFGAFVKTEEISHQPVSKRALISFGGGLSFWIMAAIIFSIVFNLGTRVAIGDEENFNLIEPRVQIATISPGSPAQIAGLEVGDIILELKAQTLKLKTTKVKEVQEFTKAHLGEEITLTIARGKEIFDVKLIPRISPPEGEGPMGVALVRTAIKKYPWYLAPWQGILTTFNLTAAIIQGYFQAIGNVLKGLPSGVQMRGPVGIFHLLNQASKLGLSYFLNFFALISIYLAIFNLLPIPATDGGKLLFLGIEVARRKPISVQIEQKINALFFAMIIAFAIWVTIQDIIRIF